MTYKISFLQTMVCFTFLVFGQNIFSQTVNDTIPKNAYDSTKVEKPKRLQFGLGFGLNFVGGTSISLSPNIMYQLNEKFSIGGGLQGSYTSIKDLQNTTTFGANILGRYKLSEKILTTLEFVELRVNTKTETATGDSTKSYWDSALFAGLGYQITPKISVGAKYNFLYKKDESVYTSPVIPFVNIGF